MARILTAGNELGDYAADGFTVWTGAITTQYNQPGGPRSPQNNGGNYYFYLAPNNGLQYDFEPVIPAGSSEFYVRMHIHAGGRTDGIFELLRFTDDLNTTLLRLGGVDLSGGTVAGGVYYPEFYPPTGISEIAQSVYSIPNNRWNLFEFYIKFAGSGGRIKLWLNDRLAIDYTGSLTGGGGEIDMHKLRLVTTQISGGTANYRAFDNIAINDLTGPINNARIGNGYVLPMWSVGAGSSSQLTNTFGTSTDNFKFVNKPLALNPSGFVGTNTPNDKDLYELPSMPDEFQGVNAIRVTGYGVRNGPAITKAKLLVKPTAQAEIDLPSGIGVGVALPIGTPTYFWQDFDNNPNSGNEPFTKGEIDGMEAGIQFIA